MTYRVTATLGRATIERTVLIDEALSIHEGLRGRAEVTVDEVKAAIRVIMNLDVSNTLESVMTLTATLITVFNHFGLEPPQTIALVESEHVPGDAEPTRQSI